MVFLRIRAHYPHLRIPHDPEVKGRETLFEIVGLEIHGYN